MTGTFDVTMVYDHAERLTSVKDTDTERDLNTFGYDSFGQCTSAVCLGKLVAAARHHYAADPGDPSTAQPAVTESCGYDATTGRPSRNDRRSSYQLGLAGYVVTPSGRLLRYDPLEEVLMDPYKVDFGKQIGTVPCQ